MDANLVNPFIEATLNILETTASTSAKAKQPYLKKDPVARGVVTGLIHLSGNTSASISVSFSKDGILSIVSNMFGEDINELNDDIKDAVGEISNMISGQATNTIAQLDNSLKATLSSVVMEDKHKVPHLGRFPAIALPFETDNGEFTIEICFQK